MYADLVLYRNELKNKNVSTYKLIGIISELILSKEIFHKNSEIVTFLYDVFGITYKDYIIKSRTMIVAHTIRWINRLEKFENKKQLLEFINKKIEKIKAEENIKEKKNKFDGWLN